MARGKRKTGTESRGEWTVRRDGAARYGRAGGVAILLTTAAVALAGCGGSKPPSVASIATTTTSATGAAKSNGSDGSTRTATKGTATGLLVEWAACMRRSGDPNQTPPTIDVHWGINITIPPGAPESLSNEVHGGTAPCNQYLAAASNALRAAHPAPPLPSDDTSGVKFAACMRANGVPAYPDPTGNRTNLRGIDMNSPLFQRANKLCGEKIGAPAWWINGWGPPGNISVTNIPAGGPGPGPPRAGTSTTAGRGPQTPDA